MRILLALQQKARAISRVTVTALIAIALMMIIWQVMAMCLFFLPVPWGIVAAFVVLMLTCWLMIRIADKRHPVLMATRGAHQ
ncbi:hypothetical protein [Janthinobacterium sp. B9-8]|uniref:hypothetical protein n=1 Tax=Janthinobacterium sp. B9-8 TaxID=1236179 RepID=UPI0012E374C6|nr:hypothetical protein [Janthinobacterium sp. B9-8]